jgi:hypothetical protein
LLVTIVLVLVANTPEPARAEPASIETVRAATKTAPKTATTCDDTDPTSCLLPWPNDQFTRADPSTPTGRRLALPRSVMPANKSGVRIDPAEWNRNDGFSPASNLVAVIPGVDPGASKLPPVTGIAKSLAADSPVVLVDLTTGKRVPAWAELDAHATDDAKRALLIVPATSLAEGHRHAVGLRGLVRADGSKIAPSRSFVRLRAHPTAEQRRWLRGLAKAGAPAKQLTLAWGFTVASARSLSGRLRSMWDATRSSLGSGAPAFTVTSATPTGPMTVVRGTLAMPRYLSGTGGPGSVLNNAGNPNGIPKRNGTMPADFLCTVPASATADKPARMLLYGHGLLNSRDEALDIGKVAATVNVGFCATDYLGMSSADVATVIREFQDLTRFRTQPDRMQQGHLAFLLLGRLLRSARGFATAAPFKGADGRPVIDTTKLALLGASEGGILGGAASSLTKDWDQVVLAVGGLGYNLLLPRSVDFDKFEQGFRTNYPDELDRVLALELMEQLWDRGENAGYAQHLVARPYPGSVAKSVLQLEAFGDHQVANVSTEKLARTLGIARRAPTLAPGRSTDIEPQWGIPAIPSLPATGSALVVWDFGTPAPPVTNTANRGGDDPHGKLGDETRALTMLVAYLNTGQLIDVCAAGPCRTPGP